MDISNLYLGQGIVFPFVLSEGAIVIDTYEQTIEASLKSILGWEFGSRFFQPTYGSKIWQALGLPSDTLSQALVRRFIIDAINLWESRITLLDTSITMPNEYTFDITLTYRINASKQVSEMNFQYVK
jgi:phage baseplate assembly protein W